MHRVYLGQAPITRYGAKAPLRAGGTYLRLRRLFSNPLRDFMYARVATPMADNPATPPRAFSGPVAGSGAVVALSTAGAGVGVVTTDRVCTVRFTSALQPLVISVVPALVFTWPNTFKSVPTGTMASTEGWFARLSTGLRLSLKVNLKRLNSEPKLIGLVLVRLTGVHSEALEILL
jgi:hypothetical protein